MTPGKITKPSLAGPSPVTLLPDSSKEIVGAILKTAEGDFSAMFETVSPDDGFNEIRTAMNALLITLRSNKIKNERLEEALSESLDKYRHLVDIIPGTVFLCTRHPLHGFSFPYVSTSSQTALGLDSNDIMHDPSAFFNRIHPRDREMVQKALAESVETLAPFSKEFRFDREGRTFWFECISRPELLPNGNIVWEGILLDITERKQFEGALRESEKRHRMIDENAHDHIWTMDSNMRYTYLNPSIAKITGYTPEEIMRLPVKNQMTPASYDLVRKVFKEKAALINRKWDPANFIKPIVLELELNRKGGGTVWVEVRTNVTRDDDDSTIKVMGITRDISERKRVEDALKESERRYRMIAENIHDVIWTMDFDLKMTYISPSVYRTTGFTPEEILQMNFQEMMTPGSGALVLKVLADEIALENSPERSDPYRSRTMEIELLRKGGGTVWVEAIASVNRDENGNALEIMGITRDITERRIADEERTRLEEHLRQAQKMESIGRMAGGVAHDFNNMLSVISGYAELIKSKLKGSDPMLKDVLEIENAAGRSRDLTRQLLAFSRKQDIQPNPADLNELIRGTQNALARLIGEDVDLRFCPGTGLWKVNVDRSQIEQILFNLAVNARDAMPEGGKLTIETGNIRMNENYCKKNPGFVPGLYVMLGISDDGVGMGKEILEHVYEPFFTTKEKGKGTGLGLSTVYGIVKQNGGFINIYSEPGKGTSFKIYIPKIQEENDAAAKAEESPAITGSGKVLLVEDDDMVRRTATEMLEAVGYSVTATGKPEEALALCCDRNARVDLMITDVIMPVMSGKELRDRVTAVRPDIKVLFISGYTSDVIVHRGVLDEGINFLQKPFSMHDLAWKVHEAINGR